MDILELIKSRRSVRTYDGSRPVDKNAIEKILEAAIWAPSGGNMQPWRFYVIKDKDLKASLCEAAYGQEYIIQAPYSIVVCIDIERANSKYKDRGKNLYSIQDTAAAVQNMLLTAHYLGLATCWIGAFDERKASLTVKLPSNLRPVAIIPVGYSDEKPVPPPRKPLKEVAVWID